MVPFSSLLEETHLTDAVLWMDTSSAIDFEDHPPSSTEEYDKVNDKVGEKRKGGKQSEKTPTKKPKTQSIF